MQKIRRCFWGKVTIAASSKCKISSQLRSSVNQRVLLSGEAFLFAANTDCIWQICAQIPNVIVGESPQKNAPKMTQSQCKGLRRTKPKTGTKNVILYPLTANITGLAWDQKKASNWHNLKQKESYITAQAANLEGFQTRPVSKFWKLQFHEWPLGLLPLEFHQGSSEPLADQFKHFVTWLYTFYMRQYSFDLKQSLHYINWV